MGIPQKVSLACCRAPTVYTDNTRRRFSTQLEEADQVALAEFLLERRREEENEPGGDFQNFLARVKFSAEKGLQVTGILNDEDSDLLDDLANLITDTDDADNFRIVAAKIHAQPARLFDDILAAIFPDDPDGARDVLLSADQIDLEDPLQDSSILKRSFFTEHFMPFLREELRRRMVLQTMAGEMGLEMDITRALVMEIIQTDEGDTLYTEIIRLKEQQDADADDQHWEGFFVPEKEGKYTFYLEAEGDATLTLKNRLLWNTFETTDDEGINFYQSEVRFLKAGQAYGFVLDGHDADDDGNIIGLFMKFENQPKQKISDKVLFPALRTEAFLLAYIRLQKAAMLVNGFKMLLTELEFFREFADKFEGLDFNALSFAQWLRLELFYRFQKGLSSKEVTLVEFLEWTNQPETEEAATLIDKINALTGWQMADIDKMLLQQNFNLNDTFHFEDEINLHRLLETLTVAKKLGVGMGNLFKWGRATSNFIVNRNIAGNIREVIRTLYSQTEWEEAIKPVHDKLRENQKQALIAYLLAQPVLMDWGVVDADSLFEFFLIDVQMDACMETSRIKQAISSVQLFVQRCFLGLEQNHGVASGDLDRVRWDWMQRYRVWEANRKVFLYPENWIEPELRDTKSPFFKELESELLQNDVSRDTVKAALTKYIVQVDEVANLEVVGQYLEGNKSSGKLHVIGRTRNAPFFFYYRLYEYDTKYWYPWQKVEVDIPAIDVENNEGKVVKNGSFVTPVIWRNRLFIFFPQFMQKNWTSSLAKQQSVSDNADSKIGDNTPVTYWEIKLGWSEYKEGKWTPKSLSNQAIYTIENIELDFVNDNIEGDVYPFIFDDPSKFIFCSLTNEDWGVIINLFYTASQLKFLDERITNGVYEMDRLALPTGNNAHPIKKSFRFNGNNARVQNRPNSTIPDRENYSFHYITEAGEVNTYPLQTTTIAQEPGDITIPVFKRGNNFPVV